jgi:hypothetical protein
MINENAISLADGSNGLEGSRILYAIPKGFTVSFEIVKRVFTGVRLGEKVSYFWHEIASIATGSRK